MNWSEKATFMDKALMQAQVAFNKGEVPIGAVIVDSGGSIVARGHNKMEKNGCQTDHAELLAIQRACAKRGDWRLDDCTLFVTLEPCLMCFGLIQLSRIKCVYYGAKSPLFGFSGFHGGIPDKTSAYGREIEVVPGLKEQESIDMLRAFFKGAREKKRGLYEGSSEIP